MRVAVRLTQTHRCSGAVKAQQAHLQQNRYKCIQLTQQRRLCQCKCKGKSDKDKKENTLDNLSALLGQDKEEEEKKKESQQEKDERAQQVIEELQKVVDDAKATTAKKKEDSPAKGIWNFFQRAREGDTSKTINPNDLRKLKQDVLKNDFTVKGTQDEYDGGITFTGEVKGEAATAIKNINNKMAKLMDNKYVAFLVKDKNDENICVVLPDEFTQTGLSGVVETIAAALLLMLTIGSSLATAALPFPLILFTMPDGTLDQEAVPGLVASAIPGAFFFLGILAAHEFGHRAAGKKYNAQLSLPLFVPSLLGIVGSFGAVTQLKKPLENRQQFLEVAAAGPAAGFAVSSLGLALGFALQKLGVGGVKIATVLLSQNAFIGVLASNILGPDVMAQPLLDINPILLASWAGFFVNAVNCLPCGDLDGGKMAFSIFGRNRATLVSTFTLLTLIALSFASDLYLYFLVYVGFLQRGPIFPQKDEVTPVPNGLWKFFAIALIFLPTLIMLPLPPELLGMDSTVVIQASDLGDVAGQVGSTLIDGGGPQL